MNALYSGVARNTAPDIKSNTFVGSDGRLMANFIKCINANGEVSYKPNPALGKSETVTQAHQPVTTTTNAPMTHSTPGRTVLTSTHPTSTSHQTSTVHPTSTTHSRPNPLAGGNPLAGSNPLGRPSMGTHSHTVTHPTTTTSHPRTTSHPTTTTSHPRTTTHPTTTTSHPTTTSYHAGNTETRRVVQHQAGPTTTTNTTAPRVGSITRDGSHTHGTTNYTSSSYQPKT